MPLTPETLPRHELAGLSVRVADATNPDLVGIAGRVATETAGTLRVRGRDAGGGVREWQVPKAGAVLEFALPCTDEAAGDSRTATAADAAPGPARDAREGPGTASERPSETAGREAGVSGGREGVAYVTVDGTRLLSRPALRTENAGDTTWR
jgi:ribonuclease P protein subunit POP4